MNIFFFTSILYFVNELFKVYVHARKCLCPSAWKADNQTKHANLLSWGSAHSMLKGQFT